MARQKAVRCGLMRAKRIVSQNMKPTILLVASFLHFLLETADQNLTAIWFCIEGFDAWIGYNFNLR